MTLQDEARSIFVGRTVKDVKVDDRTGAPVAYFRLSLTAHDGEEAFVSIDANGVVADAAEIWPDLP